MEEGYSLHDDCMQDTIDSGMGCVSDSTGGVCVSELLQVGICLAV